ncbi:MAG: 16S rRNA (guanine(966)-N(2))-methyltransferase RsmD [Actinomycetia bacterium]|nr:16S rRNA (guanine(966)-N(2))-methyltransferase RsmD [Actinomycetes bacterium]
MPRIIGGRAKGRRLAVPARGTRPTSDRAREALFNTLDGLLELAGAHVLDLYAGSGAVGLEALSRGAARATLVESNAAAAATAAGNMAALALAGATLTRRPVERFVAGPPPADAPCQLVFADPPYALGADRLRAVLAALAAPGWLAPGAVLVVERSARDGADPWPNVIEPIKHMRYGEAILWYGRLR